MLDERLRPVGLAGPRAVRGLNGASVIIFVSAGSVIFTCSCCCRCCLVLAPLPEVFFAAEAFDVDDALDDADEVDEDGFVGTGVLRPFLLLNKTAVLLFTPAGEGV